MKGFITYCFGDWQSGEFQRGVMRMRQSRKTDEPIRRSLKKEEREGRDYYVKADPDFSALTYSVCHRKLRQLVEVGDVLFFRTLWRGQQYLVGYFLVREKRGISDNPILVADPERSVLVHFKVPVTLELARKINPAMHLRTGAHRNSSINGRLGRNFKRLDAKTTRMLIKLIKARKNATA